MAVSKVIYGGDTVIDITDSTVTADTLTAGTVGYAANGERTTGRFVANLPVGFLSFSLSPTIPTGWLPCDGSTFIAMAYNDLWTHILEENNYKTFDEWQALYDANDGNVPYFAVHQGGSQTQWRFRTPSIKGWVRGGTTDEVGTYLPAGLPNITGSAKICEAHGSFLGIADATGVLSGADVGTLCNPDGGNDKDGSVARQLNVDASGSSPVYGASDTVQPSSVVGIWIVKAFDAVTNVAGQDVADMSASLTAMESRVSALENAPEPVHITDTYQNGAEWYRKYSDGWIEQGGKVAFAKPATVTLNRAFTTTNYTIMQNVADGTATAGSRRFEMYNGEKTTTSFQFKVSGGDGNATNMYWYACGY